MEQTSEQTPGSGQPITVDTEYFDEVLTHFNEDGYLINKNTRFNIKCHICQTAHLSLLNHEFDQKSRDTHEPFAVLPRCSHAFGYECITQWIIKDINIGNPQCPTCRKNIFSSRMQPEVLPIFGICEPEEQHLEIIDIRESLRRSNTPPAQSEDPAEPRAAMDLSRDQDWVILQNPTLLLLSEEEERRAFGMLWGRPAPTER